MHDRPTANELIAAARHFLECDLLPQLSDARLRFQTLVAANVLSIAERELQSEESSLADEWKYLAARLKGTQRAPQSLADLKRMVRDGNRLLCERIRAGDFDEPARFRQLSAELRKWVERKLEVANPRYLATFRGTVA